MSRALGETAPLLVIGALTYVPFVPDGPWSPFTALPIQIFAWVSRPGTAFRANAAAAILVLLAVLLTTNGLAHLGARSFVAPEGRLMGPSPGRPAVSGAAPSHQRRPRSTCRT